jgi:hypothetical protein
MPPVMLAVHVKLPGVALQTADAANVDACTAAPALTRPAPHWLGEHDSCCAVFCRMWISLASGYPFRTEQAQVGQLNNVASKMDASSGLLQVCDFQVTAISGAGCPIAQPGTGFLHESIGQPGQVVVSWDFVATPDSILDGVIGLSQNRASSFADRSTEASIS